MMKIFNFIATPKWIHYVHMYMYIEQMDTRKLLPTTSCTNFSLLLGALVNHQDWKCTSVNDRKADSQ